MSQSTLALLGRPSAKMKRARVVWSGQRPIAHMFRARRYVTAA